MKLKQVKCPNCGASIKLKSNDTQVECDFCRSSFHLGIDTKVKVYHYAFGIRITPLRLTLIFVVAALLIAGIIIGSIAIANSTKKPEEVKLNRFEHPLAYKYEGTYLAGTDIEPGEYMAFADPAALSRARVIITLTPNASAGTINCIYENSFKTNCYFTVAQGQYIKISDANILLVGAVKAQKNKDGAYPSFTYLKEGVDIIKGLYVINSKDTLVRNYIYEKDGKEKTFIGSNRMLVLVPEGGYLYAGECPIPIDEAPKVSPDSSGMYLEGQYIIGKEIPEGEYITRLVRPFSYGYMAFTFADPFISYDDLSKNSVSSQNKITISKSMGDYITLEHINLQRAESN